MLPFNAAAVDTCALREQAHQNFACSPYDRGMCTTHLVKQEPEHIRAIAGRCKRGRACTARLHSLSKTTQRAQSRGEAVKRL
jgi:hypothetical protein